MHSTDLHGLWVVVRHRITDSQINKDTEILEQFDQFCIEGAKLELQRDGHLTWEGNFNVEMHPYMKANCFTLVEGLHKVFCIWMLTGIGSQKVHFDIQLDGDVMKLQHSRAFCIELQRISKKTHDDRPFSLRDAFNAEEFCDLDIIAKSGKRFHCHKCILSAVFPNENWDEQTNTLSGSNEDVIAAALRYAYYGCLPSSLSLPHAQELSRLFTSKVSTFSITTAIEAYLRCLRAKHELQEIMDELEGSLQNIIHLLEAVESKLGVDPLAGFCEEPEILVLLAKKTLQEMLNGTFSLVSLCDVYVRNKDQLTREVENDIFKRYTALFSRFGEQFNTKHRILAPKFSALSTQTVATLAEALLPEFEMFTPMIPKLYKSWNNASREIMDGMTKENAQKRADQKRPKFFWGIQNAMVFEKMVEVNEMVEDFDCQLNQLIMTLGEASFCDRNGKIEILSDLLKSGIMMFVLGTTLFSGLQSDERAMARLRNAASLLSCILDKVRKQRGSISVVIETVADFVNKDSFNTTLRNLGLTEPANADPSRVSYSHGSNKKAPPGKYLTSIAPAEKSLLPSSLERLLVTSQYSDLKFKVTRGTSLMSEISHRSCGSEVVFSAHRVVVAARCKWFERALKSGMKESLEREFHIKDCSPEIFMELLRYLYTGCLVDLHKYSAETLADLMTTADRFEVEDLVELCESHLMLLINEDNIRFIESFANGISAKRLENAIISRKDRYDACDGDSTSV